MIPTPCKGGCACGAVRYDLRAEPLTVYACHCTYCQRHFGTAFGISMFVARSSIEVLQGKLEHYEFSHEDGPAKRGQFCPRCATRLWGLPVKTPELATLRPGTLDDQAWFEPVGHIWVSSARPWVTIPKDSLCYDGQPPDLRDLIAAWKARSIR